MAEDYQRVVDLPVKTSSGISLLSDYLMGIDANDGYQMLINDLAKKIVEDYVGSSLGGSSRTLKSALDAISTLLGSATMGTTAQTVTGAIAEHEGDISGIGTTIGNTSMGTTATTLTGAIAEHEGDIDGINDFVGDTTMGTTATTITGAIAEHEGDISTLNSNLVKVALTRTSAASRGEGFLIYDPAKKSVRIYATFYNATAIANNAVLFTVPSGYRPPSTVNVMCFYQSTSGGSAYVAPVNANGNVVNSLGATTISGLIVGEYLLQ